MYYSEFVDLYEAISKTPKRLEKVALLSRFIKKISEKGKPEWIYLLNGKVSADFDSREFGISRQLTFKSISSALGIKQEKVVAEFNKSGDLGDIAEKFLEKRNQSVLFSKKLTVDKVFDNLKKILDIEGKGAVDKKLDLISELFTSASGKEAKYIVRTLLNDLRIGVAGGVLTDSLAEAFFPSDPDASTKIEEALDIANDLSTIMVACSKGISALEKIDVIPGRPMKVMLATKVSDISEAFAVCGKPAAFEYKYDGFRMLINKVNGKVTLFTRKLEDVTLQFPDVVKVVLENVKGDNFILDSEIVGFDQKTKKYLPFQSISQRIKRKYDIEELTKKIPVEVNIFDVLYKDESTIDLPFLERRKIVEKIVNSVEWKIRASTLLVTDNEEEAQKFYEQALKIGEEGVMIKSLNSEYKQGRKVGYMAKLKPTLNDLDLVIVGAEYGSGKRAGLLTSYIVSCSSESGLLEVGKVSSGLKEKEEEGFSFDEMTKLLNELIIDKNENSVTVEPKIVVSVNYQNIQQSPTYSSGFALRFPRIVAYRPDRSINDLASIEDIEKEFKRTQR